MRRGGLSKISAKLMPQPAVACVIVLSAAGAGTASALLQGVHLPLNSGSFIVAALFVLVILAEQFPIHVRVNTKVQMTTVAVFVMAVLLPPSSAALVAGAAMLLGELSVNHQKCNYPSDIATDVGRWALAALIGSEAVRLGSAIGGEPAGLIAAALMMWTWDMLSSPATLCPMSGETPRRY